MGKIVNGHPKKSQRKSTKGGNEKRSSKPNPLRRNKPRDLTASEGLQLAINYMKAAGQFGKFSILTNDSIFFSHFEHTPKYLPEIKSSSVYENIHFSRELYFVNFISF